MPWSTTSTTRFASRALAHTVISPPWGEQVTALSMSSEQMRLRAKTSTQA